MRTHASFRGDFPKDHDGMNPPGEPIAEMIACKLADRGYGVSNHDSTEYSHTFDVRSGAKLYSATIALIGDSDREWLFILEYCPSILRFLFFRRDTADHLRVLQAVHACLGGDTRVCDLRWYTDEEWNSNPSGGAMEPDE